jgi:hypothetical protein
MLQNPISTQRDFAPGGSNIPILTRNPNQSTRGFQTFGLPSGNTQGGSANKTTLGAIRMGDLDGNAPASAIYPDDIFYPPGQADRRYTQVRFENVGNNVYQPDTLQRSAATEALIQQLGEAKFKASENEPFADYFATQRLTKELDNASRNAGLEDLGYSREIIRTIVAERRSQNEEDYLRRMLGAGMTASDAQDELDGVRRANALQEARKVDDRTYQSKLLIQRMAQSRGVLSSVNEPLTSSGAIQTPMPNERMADMTGLPAFGSGGLDTNRVFLTPDYYRTFLSRSRMTQESADEMSALANATAQAQGFVPTPGMLSGMDRQNAIERARDLAASRLDSATGRSNIMLPLPPVIEPFRDIIGTAYRDKTPGSLARFRDEDVQDLSAFHMFVALNQAIAIEPSKFAALKKLLQGVPLFETSRTGDVPRRDIRSKLREFAIEIAGTQISIPFSSVSRAVDDVSIANTLSRVKNATREEILAIQTEMQKYNANARIPIQRKLNLPTKPVVTAPPVRVEGGAGRGSPTERLTPTALKKMKRNELSSLASRRGLDSTGTKAQLVQRILDSQ